METSRAWAPEGIEHGELRPIIGAVDETFWPRLRLVLMDVARGSLVLEEVAGERTYDTWSGVVRARLKALGAEVSYLGSDRAKALIKLAQTGLDCLSIPDVFPRSHALAQGYSLAICSRLRPAQQALTPARERLATAQTSHPGSVQTPLAPDMVENHEAEVKRWPDVRSAYRTPRTHLSLILPPWNLLDSVRQTTTAVEHRVRSAVIALETLMATHGLPAKDDPLTKVRKQLAGVSALIDLWGQRVERD
jgi:hypothetical protein